MDYRLIVALILAGYLVLGVISPFIRNYFKNKKGMPLEDNLGGFLVRKLFKK